MAFIPNIDFVSASVPVLLCPAGLIIIGILTDTYGRIIALQCAYIPMILSWLILAFADSYTQIMFARTVLGIPLGKISLLIPILYFAKQNILMIKKKKM